MDHAKSLNQLEGTAAGDPAPGASASELRVRELRDTPVGQLTLGDLRLAIVHGEGLPHLVPVALDILAARPMVTADLYSGDLLDAVQKVPHGYWLSHPDQRVRIERISLAALDD